MKCGARAEVKYGVAAASRLHRPTRPLAAVLTRRRAPARRRSHSSPRTGTATAPSRSESAAARRPPVATQRPTPHRQAQHSRHRRRGGSDAAVRADGAGPAGAARAGPIRALAKPARRPGLAGDPGGHPRGGQRCPGVLTCAPPRPAPRARAPARPGPPRTRNSLGSLGPCRSESRPFICPLMPILRLYGNKAGCVCVCVCDRPLAPAEVLAVWVKLLSSAAGV